MIDFRIERAWERDGYNVWLIERRQSGSFICKPVELTFEELKEWQLIPEPSLKIDGIFGREILQAVHRAMSGIVWCDDEGIANESCIQKAMQEHINSLKQVVEKILK